MLLLLDWFCAAAAVFVLAKLTPNVRVHDAMTAAFVAFAAIATQAIVAFVVFIVWFVNSMLKITSTPWDMSLFQAVSKFALFLPVVGLVIFGATVLLYALALLGCMQVTKKFSVQSPAWLFGTALAMTVAGSIAWVPIFLLQMMQHR